MTWRAFVLGIAALALSLAFGVAASAEEGEEVDYNRIGGYLQLTGVYAWANFGGDLDGSPTGGFDARLGNRLARHVALEFQYEYLERQNIQATSMDAFDELGVWQTNIYTHGITANVRGYPWASQDDGFFHEILGGRLQPYGLMGIGAIVINSAEGDGVGFLARFGLGVDFYVTENIYLTLEGAYALSAGGSGAPTTGKDVLPFEGFLSLGDLDHVSVGLGAAYRF